MTTIEITKAIGISALGEQDDHTEIHLDLENSITYCLVTSADRSPRSTKNSQWYKREEMEMEGHFVVMEGHLVVVGISTVVMSVRLVRRRTYHVASGMIPQSRLNVSTQAVEARAYHALVLLFLHSAASWFDIPDAASVWC